MSDTADRPAYEALLFDMDGVLIRGRATLTAVYEAAADDALEELGAAVPAAERGPFRQSQFDETMAAQCRGAGLDPETFWSTRERFASERANTRIGSPPRTPFEDTAVLADLPEPLGVVSNNRAATVEHVAADLFPGRFTVAVGRDPNLEGYRRRKPDPYYIERALDRLGVDHALYLGDRKKDLLAARRAGIDGALVRREFNREVTLDEPGLEVDGLRGLPALLER
jgi:haloacid dehalogenase superfamily, subfamily IA, variant 1 with third motif having Dx(3-4)D or Dx(3-4)E